MDRWVSGWIEEGMMGGWMDGLMGGWADIILYHTMMCYILLGHIRFDSMVSYYIILCYIVLCYIISCYIILYHIIL